ncbi:hypothetical protein QY96_01587 [Bacillus thermotolerans]|uniref:Uncharacterized protein n=1 Tax=Bacillus thermotolerans TaxID=1221996 RepID=A0A0F5IAH0_BACTR|nr:hypothetical protein QY95_00169 [Bacillus thermotolerans]KKB44629.1 hypothetical protein QY96_01587 [Bacillus thermotolerans]
MNRKKNGTDQLAEAVKPSLIYLIYITHRGRSTKNLKMQVGGRHV